MIHKYTDADCNAIYRVIRERRDVRRFINKEIPDDVLMRILKAGTHAPSVGYMQPWNFLLIRSLETRAKIHKAFVQANNEALRLFEEERAIKYQTLKLEGILDSTLNICVTCDRTRFGAYVLGRTCQPEMDIFCTVCTVQNLWLAARSEGGAVDWVSILHREDLIEILDLPENIFPVAYLCIGHTESFDELAIEDLIFKERWGNKKQLLPK